VTDAPSGRRSGPAPDVLVLGVGNVLMGDEGAGVHAVRLLEREGGPPGATLVDGGTGGFHLLSYLTDYPRVIMIDATLDGRPPGTVAVLEPKYATDFPRTLSAHDIGLRDLVESAALTGPLPWITLVTVSIANVQPMCLTLSPDIEAALPDVVAVVRRVLDGPLASEDARASAGGTGPRQRDLRAAGNDHSRAQPAPPPSAAGFGRTKRS
jgi:hydrogenase maturation protease